MPTLRQSNSFSPGKYRGHVFDVDRLKRFVEGTNRAIQAGVSIPLLMEHAPINASDAETVAFAQQPKRGAGWLTRLDIDAKGEVAWEAKDVPADIQKDVEAGAIKFTSPEFRESYTSEKEGVYDGPIIRHMAITHTPGNPHQGKIETIALQEQLGCFQFSEDDFEPLSAGPDDEDGDDDDGGDDDDTDITQHAESYAVGKRVKQKSTGIRGEVVSVDDNKYKVMLDNMGDHPHDIDFSDLDEDDGPEDTNKKNVAGDNDGIGEKGTGLDGKGAAKSSEQHAEIPPKAGKFGKPENDEPDAPDEIVDVEEAAESPPVNPDMPPKATDKTKLSAVIAGLAQKNVVLPSDWSPESEGAMDILLGCLNSSIKAEQSSDAEKDDVEADEQPVKDSSMPFSEEGPTVPRYQVSSKSANAPKSGGGKYRRPVHIRVYDTHHEKYQGRGSHGAVKEWNNVDSRYGGHKSAHGSALLEAHTLAAKLNAEHEGSQHAEEIQFSEDELSAMTPKARAAIEAGVKALAASRKAEQDAKLAAAQFAEQAKVTSANAAKYKAKVEIESHNLPPALTAKLLTDTSLQFSEANAVPTFTAQQVALMFSECIPPALNFLTKDVTNAKLPVDANGNRVTQFFEKGEAGSMHMDADRAEEVVAANPLFKNMSNPIPAPSTIEDFVRRENARVPNNVMRK